MNCDFLIVAGGENSEPDLVHVCCVLNPGSTVLRARFNEKCIPFLEPHGNASIKVDAWINLSDPFIAGVDKDGSAARHRKLVAVGYSDDANRLVALAACTGLAVDGAILVRPTATFDRVPPRGICSFPLLVLSGQWDHMVTPLESALLSVQLAMAGANVTHRQLPNGHGLSRRDREACWNWLAEVWTERILPNPQA